MLIPSGNLQRLKEILFPEVRGPINADTRNLNQVAPVLGNSQPLTEPDEDGKTRKFFIVGFSVVGEDPLA